MASVRIAIKTLRDIAGDALLNEIFLDNVFVSDNMIVGAVNDGWRLARATLPNERVAMVTGIALGNPIEELFEVLSEPIRCSPARSVGEVDSRCCDRNAAGPADRPASWRRAGQGAKSSVRKLIEVHYQQALAEYMMDISEGGFLMENRVVYYFFLDTQCLTIVRGTE